MMAETHIWPARQSMPKRSQMVKEKYIINEKLE